MIEFVIANRRDKYRGFNRTEQKWVTGWLRRSEDVEKLINILYGGDNVNITEFPAKLHSTTLHEQSTKK